MNRLFVALVLICSSVPVIYFLAKSTSQPVTIWASGPKTEITLLSSGFSLQAQKMYSDSFSSLLRDTSEPLVVRFPNGNLSAIVHSRSSNFWKLVSSGNWESATFQNFFWYLDSSTVLVDFGTWIGPTLLFGAQLSSRAFGIEADPKAVAEIEFNLKMNVNVLWASRTFLQPGCVSTRNEARQMRSKDPGNSMSSLGLVSHKKEDILLFSWEVQCYTLPFLFDVWKINPETEHVFVKIDVESFECALVQSFEEWLRSLRRKPTLHVAFHSQIVSCSHEEYASVQRIMSLYKYTSSNELGSGEFVWSDIKPSLFPR